MQGRDERARGDRGGMDHLAATPHRASDAGRSQENLDAAVHEQIANHVAYLAHQRLYRAVNDRGAIGRCGNSHAGRPRRRIRTPGFAGYGRPS